MSKVVLKARDLDGYLSDSDRASLARMDALYAKAIACFGRIGDRADPSRAAMSAPLPKALTSAASGDGAELVALFNEMGALMQEICAREDRIDVYSFTMPAASHGEASRLIAKLRDVRTQSHEFVYYTQRAYELLFNLAYGAGSGTRKNYLLVPTPVSSPVNNFAVHKIPDIDSLVGNSVMCVMLRGALLPSMIMSKEIEEFSSGGYVTPFALFKIKRDDTKDEKSMEYILDLDRSYFNLDQLDGRDLVFADPMNATGGSLVTVIKYILDQGVRPASIRFFTTISALKGALRVVRAVGNIHVYTLWMDPALNDAAYIMPGLGDAGDRINGKDEEDDPRDMIRLIADYGTNIAKLYRSQIRVIEKTVLGR